MAERCGWGGSSRRKNQETQGGTVEQQDFNCCAGLVGWREAVRSGKPSGTTTTTRDVGGRAMYRRREIEVANMRARRWSTQAGRGRRVVTADDSSRCYEGRPGGCNWRGDAEQRAETPPGQRRASRRRMFGRASWQGERRQIRRLVAAAGVLYREVLLQRGGAVAVGPLSSVLVHPRQARPYLRDAGNWALLLLRRSTFGHDAAQGLLLSTMYVLCTEHRHAAAMACSVHTCHHCAWPLALLRPPPLLLFSFPLPSHDKQQCISLAIGMQLSPFRA